VQYSSMSPWLNVRIDRKIGWVLAEEDLGLLQAG